MVLVVVPVDGGRGVSSVRSSNSLAVLSSLLLVLILALALVLCNRQAVVTAGDTSRRPCRRDSAREEDANIMINGKEQKSVIMLQVTKQG
jgi:hypothetical protein